MVLSFIFIQFQQKKFSNNTLIEQKLLDLAEPVFRLLTPPQDPHMNISRPRSTTKSQIKLEATIFLFNAIVKESCSTKQCNRVIGLLSRKMPNLEGARSRRQNACCKELAVTCSCDHGRP